MQDLQVLHLVKMSRLVDAIRNRIAPSTFVHVRKLSFSVLKALPSLANTHPPQHK